MNLFLQENNTKQINKNPTDNYQKQIQHIIKQCKTQVTPNHCNMLLCLTALSHNITQPSLQQFTVSPHTQLNSPQNPCNMLLCLTAHSPKFTRILLATCYYISPHTQLTSPQPSLQHVNMSQRTLT